MYCSDCGTINPETVSTCTKCGRPLGKHQPQPKDEIDIVLAARSTNNPYNAAPSQASSKILLVLGIAAMIVLIPIIMMSLKAGQAMTPSGKRLLELEAAGKIQGGNVDTGAGGPAEDFESGLGLARKVRPEVIARDVAKKSNVARAQNALEQYHAEHNNYPASLADIDPGIARLIVDHPDYTYEVLDGGSDFRLEARLESGEASGAGVVIDGEEAKLVITGSGY